MNTIGNMVKSRREFLLLKQEDVAEIAGVTTKTIYLLEQGIGNPSINTLQKILVVLGLQLDISIKKIDE